MVVMGGRREGEKSGMKGREGTCGVEVVVMV